MCGIVGAATAMTNGFRNDEVDTFLEMLYYDALRGMDSTGVMGVNTWGNVVVHKEASQAAVFLKNNEIKMFRSEMIREGKFLVGHNRAATRGVVKDENAHPFIIDDKIVLVQNGTWKGDHKHVKDTEVDTEALAHLIHEAGDDVVSVFRKINAAYALSWYNVEKKTLYLARNDERPLWLCFTKTGSIFWCSEPGFMRLALIRNGLEVEKMEEVPKQTLISFELQTDKSFKLLDRQELPRFQFPIRHIDVDVDDGVWPYAGFPHREKPTIVHQGQPLRLPHQQRGRNRNPAEDADVDFITGFLKQHGHEAYLVSHAEAAAMQHGMASVMQSKQPIELLDYFAANSHPQCSTFFVFGTIMAVHDNDIINKCIVYWIVRNTTEEQVIDYVGKHLYSVKITTSRTNRVNSEEAFICCFAESIATITTVHDALH